VKHVLTTNSGSSANLLALQALTSPSLGERAIKPGDEVITVAAGFPHHHQSDPAERLCAGLRRFTLPTYNIDTVGHSKAAISTAHPSHHARPHAGQPVRPATRSARIATGTACG
jgi:CDP-6-deoxy-D-xylo-4-hexulose-3-dehydrase